MTGEDRGEGGSEIFCGYPKNLNNRYFQGPRPIQTSWGYQNEKKGTKSEPRRLSVDRFLNIWKKTIFGGSKCAWKLKTGVPKHPRVVESIGSFVLSSGCKVLGSFFPNSSSELKGSSSGQKIGPRIRPGGIRASVVRGSGGTVFGHPYHTFEP